MKNWTKGQALETLNDLINQFPILENQSRNSAIHMRWLANTMRLLEEVFGRNSTYYQTIKYFSWRETGQILIHDFDIEGTVAYKDNIAYQNQLQQAKGLLLAAKDHLEQSEKISDVYDGENTAPEASNLIQIINLGEKKLRKLIRVTPTNEKEVQEKYEDLLIATDIKYAREFPHIEYSMKQYIPDFSIQKLDLAIEIKLCKRDPKSLIAQINDDILAYKTKFKNLIFLIYDLGQIRDIDIFKNSIEENVDVIVQIIKE